MPCLDLLPSRGTTHVLALPHTLRTNISTHRPNTHTQAEEAKKKKAAEEAAAAAAAENKKKGAWGGLPGR